MNNSLQYLTELPHPPARDESGPPFDPFSQENLERATEFAALLRRIDQKAIGLGAVFSGHFARHEFTHAHLAGAAQMLQDLDVLVTVAREQWVELIPTIMQEPAPEKEVQPCR